MTDYKEGIHDNIPMAEYIADPCPVPSLSSTTAKALLNECPKRAWFSHPRLNPEHEWTDTAITDVGKIAHQVVLEGNAESLVIVEATDWRTKAAKEAREEARNNGQVPILAGKWPEIEAMAEAARSAFKAAEKELGCPLSEMLVERTVLWQEGDIWCRSRPDLLTPDYKMDIDYKTTGVSVHPDKAVKQICTMEYDVQGALRRRGIQKITGVCPDVVYLFQETAPPYLCSFIGLDPIYTEIADRKIEQAIKLWGQCIESGKWPGYGNRIAWVSPPPWEVARAEALAAGG